MPPWQPEPGHGEFQGERDPVKLAADGDDGGDIVGPDSESRTHLPGAGYKQGHRVERLQLGQQRQRSGRRESQGGDAPRGLAWDAEEGMPAASINGRRRVLWTNCSALMARRRSLEEVRAEQGR